MTEQTLSIPPIKQFTSLGWAEEFPILVTMTYVAIAMASQDGLVGEEMWEEIDRFVKTIRPAPELLGPMEEQIEKELESEFIAKHGPYEKTTRAMVALLVDRGLVVRCVRNGHEALEIPHLLPSTRDTAHHNDDGVTDEPIVVLKAKKRGNGPRYKVVISDLHEVRQLIEHGWPRHLPLELSAMFIIIAAQGVAECAGELMWGNIEDHYEQARHGGPPYLPPTMRREVAVRFAREYGKPYETTMHGVIGVLLDLGLIVRCERHGEEALCIPELLPYPDDKLNLDEHERWLLATKCGRFGTC